VLPLRAEIPEQEKILVSWKEIASFLDRAERTVRRWERDRGLPVHRVPGGERGGVFAYPAELQTWLLGEQGKAAQSSSEIEGDSTLEDSSSIPIERPVTPLSSPGRSEGKAVGAPARLIGTHRWSPWITLPALILGIAGTFFLVSRFDRKLIAARERDLPKPAIHLPSSRAEQMYLQGRYEWSLRTADSLNKSIDAYTQAIVQDPAYAQAYAGLAESYDLLPEYGGIDRGEAFSRAKAAAERAIALDPHLPGGHRARAFALFYGDWDAPGSDAEFKKALALAPNEVETHHWYATTLYSRREKQPALTQIDEAVRLSPTNPAILADAAFLHVSLGDDVETNIKTLRELARTQPTLVKASRYLEGIDLERRDYAAYLADLRQTVGIAHNPDESELSAAVERGWAHGGKHGLLIAMRDVHQAALARGENTAFDIGLVYLWLEQPQKALHYFNAALEQRDVRISWLRVDYGVAELEKDPNYRALLIRIDERLRLDPSPSVHLAVTTEPGKLSVPLSARQ